MNVEYLISLWGYAIFGDFSSVFVAEQSDPRPEQLRPKHPTGYDTILSRFQKIINKHLENKY